MFKTWNVWFIAFFYQNFIQQPYPYENVFRKVYQINTLFKNFWYCLSLAIFIFFVIYISYYVNLTNNKTHFYVEQLIFFMKWL